MSVCVCVCACVCARAHITIRTRVRDPSRARTPAAVEGLGGVLADCVYVHLVVQDMGRFKEINGEYCKYFGVNPPSRSVALRPRTRTHARTRVHGEDV